MKYILSFLLFTSLLLGADWKIHKTLMLKKDELVKIMILTQSVDKDNPNRELFELRWTLFHNDILTLFSSFAGFMKQSTIREVYPNKSFSVELMGRGRSVYPPPTLLVQFSEYDYENKRAVIELLLKDPKELVELDFLTKHEEKR
ncbi:MAG: hypothetical protein GQ570_12025 [Helicobacteraceae bacterium]|nr:hypothetical protein [Helicobacteraceae bacterium]